MSFRKIKTLTDIYLIDVLDREPGLKSNDAGFYVSYF